MWNATRLQPRSERVGRLSRRVERVAAGPAMGNGSGRSMWSALGLLGFVLSPVLGAIWLVPWFVTQDGPAHIYNAQIVAESFDPGSAFHDYYAIQWRPIPNWAGHLVLAGLVRVLPAWVADRLVTSLTLVGFATAILWLRWQVAGARGLRLAAVLAGLLAMNVTWLFGFTSFMLGACLFPMTLGCWWRRRNALGVRDVIALGLLLTVGYFCHLVSVGLTAVGLLLLAVWAPMPAQGGMRSIWRARGWRVGKTSVSLVPLAVLVGGYLRMSRRGGPMWPDWKHLENPFSLASWKVQLAWVDPLTLSRKVSLPFSDDEGMAFVVMAPTLWLAVALALWMISRLGKTIGQWGEPQCDESSGKVTGNDGRGWLWLAAVLVVAGIVSPDSLGGGHGNYLPQRICLLGLVCLVPAFELSLSRRADRLAVFALGGAVVLQSGILWDYAIYSDRTAGEIIRARELVGQHQRVASLLVSTRCKFRVNPLLHADHWLGVGNGNIIWNDYETQHYYFPVQFLTTLDRPDPRALELISLAEGRDEAQDRERAWAEMLSRHAESIDVLLVWKKDAGLDAVTERYFRCVRERGDVRIFERVTETAMGDD